MNKNFKKGFTIVELVIVIAVIAILSAVLIPTFTQVVDNAKQTTALTDVQAIYKEIILDDATEGEKVFYVEHNNGYFFTIINGEVKMCMNKTNDKKPATNWTETNVESDVINSLVSYKLGAFDKNGIIVKVAQA